MDVAIGMNECQSTAKRPTLGISIAETILLDNSEMNNDGKPNREGKKDRKKDRQTDRQTEKNSTLGLQCEDTTSMFSM